MVGSADDSNNIDEMTTHGNNLGLQQRHPKEEIRFDESSSSGSEILQASDRQNTTVTQPLSTNGRSAIGGAQSPTTFTQQQNGPSERKIETNRPHYSDQLVLSQRIARRKSQVSLPRLITRDYPYNQSSNRVQVFNENSKAIFWLYVRDWFHVMLRVPWYFSFFCVIFVWYLMIWVFAAVFVLVDSNTFNRNKDCGLGEPGIPITMATAYAFSLETCTTVGYGLPGSANGFFESNCKGVQIAITLQMIWSMLSNAFLVSFFFTQMSKSEMRSIQIIFSKKLCVNVVDGKVCINIRCYDLDSAHPLVECHARMYLMDHQMKFQPLRLLEPNDNLGGVLYPSAPTTIIHHIDHHSALSPRSMPLVVSNHGLHLRSVDSGAGNREEILCPVCGESYGSYERLQKHINYARIVESQDDYPVEGTHLGFEMPDTSPLTLAEAQRHIESKLSEIVVVVEAIDPQLSGTFQALQSYKYDDIEFGADFENCMSTKDNKFMVDLMKFHGIIYDDGMYASSEFKGKFRGRSDMCTPCTNQSEPIREVRSG